MQTATIALTRGLSTIVDSDDYADFAAYSWQAIKGRNGVYYARRNSSIYLHREVYKKYYGPIPRGLQIDHVDYDGLNNTFGNLRLSNHSLQQHNSSFKKNNSTSSFRGVFYDRGFWSARIYKDGVLYDLGCFNSEIEAAITFDRKASELYGSYARLNLVE